MTDRKPKVCPKCGSEPKRSERFDAYYCPTCKRWLETPCEDPSCLYCKGRPESAEGEDSRPCPGGCGGQVTGEAKYCPGCQEGADLLKQLREKQTKEES